MAIDKKSKSNSKKQNYVLEFISTILRKKNIQENNNLNSIYSGQQFVRISNSDLQYSQDNKFVTQITKNRNVQSQNSFSGKSCLKKYHTDSLISDNKKLAKFSQECIINSDSEKKIICISDNDEITQNKDISIRRQSINNSTKRKRNSSLGTILENASESKEGKYPICSSEGNVNKKAFSKKLEKPLNHKSKSDNKLEDDSTIMPLNYGF